MISLSTLSILLLFAAFPNPCFTIPYEFAYVNEFTTTVEPSNMETTNLGMDLEWNHEPTESSPPRFLMETDFREEFKSFETHMKSFIDNVRREQLSTITNNGHFLKMINEYMARLPMNDSAIVKTRDYCHCDGEIMKPCPLKCMYSCYAINNSSFRSGWHYEDDCRKLTLYGCQCIQGSSTGCSGDMMDNCFNLRSCSHYSIDKQQLIKSFDMIVNLLVEPIKIFFRGMESRLTFLRQAAYSIHNLSSDICSADTSCSPKARLLLSTEKKNYREMKGRITLEMVRTQSQIENVSENVEKLKEEALAKINRSIKEYSCCMRGLDITIDGYNCSDATNPTFSKRASAPCPHFMFACDDGKCISLGQRCNGINAMSMMRRVPQFRIFDEPISYLPVALTEQSSASLN